MESTNIYLNSALAQAAYADLVVGKTNFLENEAALLDLESGAGMTQTQVDRFILDYTDVIAISDDPLSSGFSAAVFESKSGELVLAIRGTDELDGSDLDDDLNIFSKGFAAQQIVEMHNWWNRVTAQVGSSVNQLRISSYTDGASVVAGAVFLYSTPSVSGASIDYYLEPADALYGTGELSGRSNQPLSVVGHSLGGHLAMAFGSLFSEEVESVLAFNAPGFKSDFDAQRFFSALGGSVPAGASINNIVADETSAGEPPWKAIAGWHSRPGNQIDIAIENQVLSNEPEPIPLLKAANHSIRLLTDSLAVYDLLHTLSPMLSASTYDEIFQISSEDEYKSLEQIVDSVSSLLGFTEPKLIAGNGVDQREALYNKIYTIQESPTYSALSASGAFIDSSLSPQNARSDFGEFLSIVKLSPVVIHAHTAEAHSALKAGNSDLESDWARDQSELDGLRVYTDNYLTDKSQMLSHILNRNTEDLAHPTPIPGESPAYYYDHVTGQSVFTGQVDLPSGGSLLDEYQVRRIILGADESYATLLGGALDDKLYGQGGSDVLNGFGGNDFLDGGYGNDELAGGAGDDRLIGGVGADSFQWNNGDGNDFIGDYDDGGDRILVNGIDLSTLQFEQISPWSTYYRDSSNLDISLHYDGSFLEVSVEDGTGSGSITASQYSPVGDQNYGIELSDYAAPDSVTDFTVVKLGSDFEDNEVRYAAFDRRNQGGLDWTNIAIRFNADDVVNYEGGSFYGLFSGTFEGGPASDHLTGDNLANAFYGYSGNDRIEGGLGTDYLAGGAGSDSLFGGEGDDILIGSTEIGELGAVDPSDSVRMFYASQRADIPGDRNILDGGAGKDIVSGGEYRDEIEGGSGDDTLLGNTGHDVISGGIGADRIYGDSSWNMRFTEQGGSISAHQELAFADGEDDVGQYNDIVHGGDGDDSIWGELGDDVLYGDAGNDHIYGDRFDNTEYYTGPWQIYDGSSPALSTSLHGNDRLYGGAGEDVLRGLGGDDDLTGGKDDDFLIGGAGDDLYRHQAGDGFDAIIDTEGVHTLLFSGISLANLTVTFQGEGVHIGASFDEGFYLTRTQWSNIKIAQDTPDMLIERSRLDTNYYGTTGALLLAVEGSDGSTEEERDQYFEIDDSDPGEPKILLKESVRTAELQANALLGGNDGATLLVDGDNSQWTLGLTAEQLDSFDIPVALDDFTLKITGFREREGTVNADWITGTEGADQFNGMHGNDVLEGLGGDDVLAGGSGHDELFGGDGADELLGSSSSLEFDYLEGGRGADTLLGGEGFDTFGFRAGDGQDLLSDSGSYQFFEFDESVSPSSIVLHYTDTTDASIRLEYGLSDSITSFGTYSSQNIRRVRVGGMEIPLVQRSDLENGTFYSTYWNDVIETGSGNDTIHANGIGSDVYRFGAGDGQDLIQLGTDSSNVALRGDVQFLSNVGLSAMTFTFSGEDTVISYGSGDQITLESNLAGNALTRFTLSSEANPDWVPVIHAQGEGTSTYGSYGTDIIVGSASHNIIRPGYGNDLIVGGDSTDWITLNDMYLTGSDVATNIGSKHILGRGGDDYVLTPLHQGLTFHFDRGDGHDVIDYDWSYSSTHPYQFNVNEQTQSAEFVPFGEDRLIFGSNVQLSDLSFTRLDDNLRISLLDGTGSILVNEFFHAWDSADSENDGHELYALLNDGEIPDGYSLLDPELSGVLPATPISELQFSDGQIFEMGDVLDSFLTLSGVTISGTDGNDRLFGTEGDDVLDAGAGDDLLSGGAGNDVLDGGAGGDLLAGGAGDDLIRGGEGDDLIVGGLGNDVLRGEGGNDFFLVQGEDQGVDQFIGGDGFDTILGGSGDDIFTTSQMLIDSESIEKIDGGLGINQLAGSQGDDILDFRETELLGIALISGGAGDDHIQGSEGNNVISGGYGNDTLSGHTGDDLYVFWRDQGQDEINNDDAALTSTDSLWFLGVEHDDLWLSRDGNNLLIDVVGTDDQVKINDWYAQEDDQLDVFYSNGRLMLGNQVDQLVNAMANFDVPVGVGAFIPQATQMQLESTLSAVWQAV